MLFRSSEFGLIPSPVEIRYKQDSGTPGQNRATAGLANTPVRFWSVVTSHRFAQATGRRSTPTQQRNPTLAPPLARAAGAPMVSDTRGCSTATRRLGKAVTSHRTPKRAGEPSGADAVQAPRNRWGSGFIPYFKDTWYYLPQHFLYFLPLPQGHGSLRPVLGGAM